MSIQGASSSFAITSTEANPLDANQGRAKIAIKECAIKMIEKFKSLYPKIYSRDNIGLERALLGVRMFEIQITPFN